MGLEKHLSVSDWHTITQLAEKLRIVACTIEGTVIAPGHLDRHPWATLSNERKKKWLTLAKTAHEFYNYQDME